MVGVATMSAVQNINKLWILKREQLKKLKLSTLTLIYRFYFRLPTANHKIRGKK